MSLPKGYKRLEYIQSSGTQYVKTNFYPNNNTRVFMDFAFTGAYSGNIGLCGARTNSTSKAYCFWFYTDYITSCRFDFASNSDKGTEVKLPSGEKLTLDMNQNTCVCGDFSQTKTDADFQCDYDLALFGINTAGTVGTLFTGKLYSCQIYDNGTLVRDFIPCQNASGAVGLWDAVNSVFYGNAGTGTFTAGPVVPEIVDESEITELEYIQSSGVQYVDTLFNLSSQSRVVMDVDLLNYATNAYGNSFFGARSASNANSFLLLCARNSAETWTFMFNGSSYTGTIDRLGRHLIDANGSQCTIDGVTISATSAEFTCDYPCYLFTDNKTGTANTVNNARMKLYSCKIFNNGLLERDYIPAMLNNGEVGLYDRVFHEFYRNDGTGEFIAGPEAQTVPKAPANFRVESESDTLVTLAWDASDKALGYRLYRQGQLLADITETSVSVEVEPFAGAVFTLTAYNENGEGAGTSLTYYSIPENPLLHLITDRTAQDVTERNPKGYYAASDLNRVGYAIDYLAPIIRGYGYTLEVHTKTDWTDEDWKLTGEMVQYLQSLNNLKSVFSTLVELPETMEKIDYRDANNIELLLLTIDETVARVVAGFTRANAFGLRSGAKGLPASQSDRGRNWGQLDAMETTWANWQLATWYLLLYGNFKAEGVVT